MAAQQIAMIGLGKMGFNLALNLKRNRLVVFAFDTNPELRKEIQKDGVDTADSLKEICDKFSAQRIIWLMVPSGEIVDTVIKELLPHLQENDIVIDGGNSFYKDSVRRYEYLKQKQIHFLDCGTSGGQDGALNGACTMIGGDKDVYQSIQNVFDKISVENGSLYAGKSGSGHFVKMIHNGIEYGMMQSIAEGFEFYFTGLTELLWNKKRILEVYLNTIEMGPGIFGIEAAAEHYFHKHAKNLSREEAAKIIACLPNPKKFSVVPESRRVAWRYPQIIREMSNIEDDKDVQAIIK